MNRPFRKFIWWLGHSATTLIALTACALWIALGNWAIALSFAVFALASAFAIPTSWWSYLHGYHRASHDLMEALSRAETPEELQRLTSTAPPRPWE